MSEHGYHILFSIVVEMVRLVALVQDISHHLWWWRIDNGRRDDVGHVAVVPILGYSQFRIRIKLANSRKVNISSKTRLACMFKVQHDPHTLELSL